MKNSVAEYIAHSRENGSARNDSKTEIEANVKRRNEMGFGENEEKNLVEILNKNSAGILSQMTDTVSGF